MITVATGWTPFGELSASGHGVIVRARLMTWCKMWVSHPSEMRRERSLTSLNFCAGERGLLNRDRQRENLTMSSYN